MNHLRPFKTSWLPIRLTEVCKLVGSDEPTSGSVIANAERIFPANKGANQRSRCIGLAKRCNNSILPVSGALQLNTSAAQGMRPMISAKGA